VYAPFSIRETLAEHINVKISDAKSRQLAGLSNMIWGFETTSKNRMGDLF
jgi:hypothetical protein